MSARSLFCYTLRVAGALGPLSLRSSPPCAPVKPPHPAVPAGVKLPPAASQDEASAEGTLRALIAAHERAERDARSLVRMPIAMLKM